MTEIERFWRELAHDPQTPRRVKTWREHRHHTQRTLATEAGCAVTTINEIETGKRPPRVSTLKHLVRALGISPWMLRKEPGDPDVPASQVAGAIADLDLALDAYEASGRDAASIVAHDNEDDAVVDVDLDAIEHIRRWAIQALEAAGWSPAGTLADHAARLTGREAELARAWGDFQAVVNDITAEAQRDPRWVAEHAATIFGNPPMVC